MNEHKAEAEKIAREIAMELAMDSAHIPAIISAFLPHLLNFREKDVRELVEALEPFAAFFEEVVKRYGDDEPDDDDAGIHFIHAPDELFPKFQHCRKAAALVRKFNEGKL